MSKTATGERVSHGMCPDCYARLSAEVPRTARELLDDLEVPVMVMYGDGTVAGNRRACSMFGTGMQAIDERLGGHVTECADAHLPNGCGRPEHCTACTIRNAVTYTVATGKGVTNVTAMPAGAVSEQSRTWVSSEMVGELVVLKLNEGAPPPR